MKLGVRSQITLFFGGIFTAVFLLILIPSSIYIRQTTEKDMEVLATQTLRAIDSSIVAKLDELNNVTDIVMINQPYQSKLDDATDELAKGRVVSNALFGILLYDSSIMSAVYCDTDGSTYYHTNSGGRYTVDSAVIQSPEWRSAIMEARGELVYFENGGNALDMINNSISDEYVSFVRDINRITDYSCMGTLMLNISRKNLANMLLGGNIRSGSEIFILDQKNQVITSNSSRKWNMESLIKEPTPHYGNFYVANTETGSLAVSSLPSQYSGWSILSITPLSQLRSEVNYSNSVLLLTTVLVAVMLIFAGQLYLSVLVVHPLATMARAMEGAESGVLVPMEVNRSFIQNEITDLQSFYNRMIVSIQNLTQTIKREERIKRKNEISLLQEQIKPHFLYNALDAISALALMDDSQTVYTLTQALSGFYRTSLNMGYDTVSVETELKCVRDYVKVLNIRYKDKICLKVDAPPNLLQEKTLKMLLQPLVENAVYHGLRQRDGVGCITVTVRMDGKFLIFTVWDDGVGMTQERLGDVLSGRSRQAGHGFGIYSLIEKLRLAGAVGDPLKITSIPGSGTTAEITMPLMEEE